MSLFDGVVVGIVDDLNDREGLGRIRVTFPWLADSVKSYWARPARLMAGEDRGTFFMPEKGDEALVAFEHGDVRFPYIVGFLWNGVDKPPNGDIDNSVRRIRTTSDHQIDFDDRGGKETIRITTHGKHVVDLNDADRKISVTSKGKHEVVMDDAGQKITITSAGKHSVTLDDIGGSLTVTSAGKHRIALSDMAQTVSITTPGGHSVTLNDIATSILVTSTPGGSIAMTPAGIVLAHGHSISITPQGIAFA